MTPVRSLIMACAAAIAVVAAPAAVLAQSAQSADARPPRAVKPPKIAPPAAAADMQAVLDALGTLGGKPIETLTPAMARMQPTPADAVKAVMLRQGRSTADDGMVVTQDMAYGSDAKQFARIYRPAKPRGTAPMPLVVYYHGGGWVIADVGVYDAAPRLMSQQLNAIVVSVEYRHAPEFKFPAQHDDAAAAYRWALQNAAAWGADTTKIALAGESAGGNLALNTAIYARDNGLTMPQHVLAVYPIADTRKTLPSRRDSANAKPLNTPMLAWFSHYYQRRASNAQDPRLNLVKANLAGLPPVTVINAQIDPLRSDGDNLTAALLAARTPVEQRTYPGVAHEFFGMGKVVRGAWEAQNYAISRIAASWAMNPMPSPMPMRK